ncbi:MAG TPA: protein translocase subunit SecF [Gemmatimonadaceae bacterium]
MLRILHDTKYDFIKYWKRAAILTIAWIIIGLGFLAIHGVNYSIEFTSGTLIQAQFKEPPRADDIRSVVDQAGFPNSEITKFGSDTEYTIRAQPHGGVTATVAQSDSTGKIIQAALQRRYPNAVSFGRTEYVGPRVGQELRTKATEAVLISFLVTLIYLAIRFEWRFGLAATIATAHDVLTTLAFLAMLRLEISLTVVAAILTVIGYSLNDTIIIFDRVRENLRKQRKESLRDVLNRSINETLPRSVLTHATTLAATLALLFFAGEVIRPFAWIMAFGIFTGTFSSIYVAGALLLWIERKWPRATGTEGKGAARAVAEDRRRSRQESAVVGR